MPSRRRQIAAICGCAAPGLARCPALPLARARRTTERRRYCQRILRILGRARRAAAPGRAARPPARSGSRLVAMMCTADPACSSSLGHRRRGVDHMLAGVQHQQQVPRRQRLRHALGRNLADRRVRARPRRRPSREPGRDRRAARIRPARRHPEIAAGAGARPRGRVASYRCPRRRSG